MKTVLVGMSGGVDSTVSAVMLSKAGYKVIGVMLDLFSELNLPIAYQKDKVDYELFTDLKKRFDIDFHLIDAGKEFKQKIVDYFVDEYIAGRTPSPCVKCNIFIKFGFMAELMKDFGADYIATGHYARIFQEDGLYYIRKAKNLQKDQSYFLFGIKKELLPKIIFPLGTYDKNYTRDFAKGHSLNVHSRPDSQDICFVGDDDYRTVLKKMMQGDARFNNLKKEGLFRDKSGQILGKHQGYYNYTTAQRRNLGLDYHKRLYVLKTDPNTGDVVLSPNKDDLLVYKFYANRVNTFNKDYLDAQHELIVKDHSGMKGLRGKALLRGDNLEITLIEPSYFVTVGQAVVLYHKDLIIAGAWIVSKETIA